MAAPHSGTEPRIETQSSWITCPSLSEIASLTEHACPAFPGQLKKNPGLITLTQTTLFFIPLLSSHAILTIPLPDITGVRKTSITKGVDVHYTVTREDGTREEKAANFMFVGSRSDLFARLVSWGGKRFASV